MSGRKNGNNKIITIPNKINLLSIIIASKPIAKIIPSQHPLENVKINAIPIVTNNNIKILLAGGDGTISRCIEDLKKEEIPLSRCIFAPVPLGTGNVYLVH